MCVYTDVYIHNVHYCVYICMYAYTQIYIYISAHMCTYVGIYTFS